MVTPLSLYCDACGAALTASATRCPVCDHELSTVSSPQSMGQDWRNGYAPVSGAGAIGSVIAGPLRAGELLQGRYRILGQIGEGGFGVVYKARDMKRQMRLVAIKQINLSALSSQEKIEATDSYNREVMLLSKLSHQSLPRIYEHFTDPEHWYVVMDYIEGETLEEHLKKVRGGRLPVWKVVDIGINVCDVLHYLHMQRPAVIFRDVKPANIMYTRDGRIYLIDFGIARRYSPGKAKDTGPLGSPGYAAPEQYGKAQTTVQTDIYGLGATLQTLLTGREPLELVVSGEQQKLLSKLPERLYLLLQQMLERDASQRPRSMEEVKDRLQHVYEKSQFEQKAYRIFMGAKRLLYNSSALMTVMALLCTWGIARGPVAMQWFVMMLCVIVGRMTFGLHQEITVEMAGGWQWGEAWAILRQRFNEARGFVFAVTVISWFMSVAYHPDWYLDWYGADMLLFTGILYICVGLALYCVVDFLIRSLIARLVALRKKRRLAQSTAPLQQQQQR